MVATSIFFMYFAGVAASAMPQTGSVLGKSSMFKSGGPRLMQPFNAKELELSELSEIDLLEEADMPEVLDMTGMPGFPSSGCEDNEELVKRLVTLERTFAEQDTLLARLAQSVRHLGQLVDEEEEAQEACSASKLCHC